MKVLLFIFLSLLIIEPTFAQSLANPTIGKSANLCSLATRQYLSGKSEESLALYQKAIAKAEGEYGKNSRMAGDLYYQLGVRAFWLSKFNLAEHSLKKAVEINPNSEVAQLMLINLLRFRNRDGEASAHIQQALKKHPDSVSLRKDLAVSLQERDPYRASQQAYLVNSAQNGITQKIPVLKSERAAEPDKPNKNDKKETAAVKKALIKPDSPVNKKSKAPINQINKAQEVPQNTGRAVYEPIKTDTTKEVKPRSKRIAPAHKRSGKLPAGLVPPPPPDTIGFPAVPGSGLRAKAGSIKLAKPHIVYPAEESQKPTIERPSGETDPDFLIEWASVKKKHQPTK